MNPIEEMNEIAGHGKEDLSDMPTIFDQIHRRSQNDAIKIGRIAMNLSALAHGAYELLYDHAVIHFMITEGWIDSQGVERKIVLAEQTGLVDGVLHIQRSLYDDRDLQMNNIKELIGRYLCGFHLRLDKKLSEKLRRAVYEKSVSEFTAYGNHLNSTFFERTIEEIEFMIDTFIEMAFDVVLRIQPHFASAEEFPAIREFAQEVGMIQYDNPGEFPFTTLFDAVVTSGLFMDDRGYELYKLHRGIVPAHPTDVVMAESARLNFIVAAMVFVKF